MISPDIVIITKAELEAIKTAAFHRGVARGKFEAGRITASAIEAASAGETGTGSTEGESAAPEGGDARKDPA